MAMTILPASRSARLVALSQTAQEQSIEAIRSSLRLLRQPTYPTDRPVYPHRQSTSAIEAEQEGCRRVVRPHE